MTDRLWTWMLSVGVVVFLLLVVAWMSIWAHDDPGDLVRNFAIATAGWGVWMGTAVTMLRRRGGPRSGLLV